MAQPQNTLVALSAPALYYPRPHNRRILNTVTVTAVGSQDVLFKVKGLKPEPYHVKPKTDVLCAGQSVDIQFTRAPSSDANPPFNEGFVIEVAALPSNLDARAVQGNRDKVKDAFSQVPKENIQKGVRLESIFNIDESQLPPTGKVSALNEGDSSAVSLSRASMTPRGVSAASAASASPAATAAATGLAAAAGSVADAAEKVKSAAPIPFDSAPEPKKEDEKKPETEKSVQQQLTGLKSKVKEAKAQNEEAESASHEHQSYAKGLQAAGNSKVVAAPKPTSGASKSSSSSELRIPVSLVVLLMLLAYTAGLFCRQTYGPAHQWLESLTGASA